MRRREFITFVRRICPLLTQSGPFVNIELRLGYPKSFFEGALEWMFMPTSERDDVGSLFLRQFVRIVTTLRSSLVMDEKHLLRSRVPIHVEEGFQDVDNELHRCLFII